MGEGGRGTRGGCSVCYLHAASIAFRTEKILSNYLPNELTYSTRCRTPVFRFKYSLLVQIQTLICDLQQVTFSLHLLPHL